MRLFIASPAVIGDYAALRAEFDGIIEGKWVEEKNLHLTWVFLGEVAESAGIIEKMGALRNPERSVALRGLGDFSSPPKVLYIAASDRLLYDTARSFRSEGFDLYRFVPHVTICRIKRVIDPEAYGRLLHRYRDKEPGTLLPQINLYESRRGGSGMEYRVVYGV